MKVTVYKLDKKQKPTKVVIGDFDINEIKLSDRRKLHVLEKKCNIKTMQGTVGQIGTDVNVKIDEDAWGIFYEKIGDLSGVPDSVLMKYSDDDVDVILMTIYDSWQPSEKKQ